jgi:hypothetical protein
MQKQQCKNNNAKTQCKNTMQKHNAKQQCKTTIQNNTNNSSNLLFMRVFTGQLYHLLHGRQLMIEAAAQLGFDPLVKENWYSITPLHLKPFEVCACKYAYHMNLHEHFSLLSVCVPC